MIRSFLRMAVLVGLLALGCGAASPQTAGTPISSLPVVSAINPQTDYAVGVVLRTVGGLPVYVTSRVSFGAFQGPAGPTGATGAQGPAGTGSVTSVGLSLPPIFTVSGSPVTGSGTLTGTLATQAPNSVWAGPANGAAAAPTFRALVPADEPAAADGCVRISVQSTTVLAVNPYGCNTLSIGGVPRVETAHTCSISSPAAATLYYVYEAWSGTATTCSFSATGHITGSDGREYLNASGSADTTKRLLGMVYTNTAGAPLLDNVTNRWCLNWLNRRNLGMLATVSGASYGSSTPLFFGSGLSFLTWGDEAYSGTVEGYTQNSTAGAITYSVYGVDGSQVGQPQLMNAYANNAYGPLGIGYNAVLSEGAHTTTVAGSTNTGGGTWFYAHTAFVRG